MKKLAIGIAVSLFLAAPALAKKDPPSQTHHCKLADGSMDMSKSKKQCTTSKGTWVKDAAAGAVAPGASAPVKK